MSRPAPEKGRLNEAQNEADMCDLTVEVCDIEIDRYRAALMEGSGNPMVCQEMIDKWLDCRLILEPIGGKRK